MKDVRVGESNDEEERMSTGGLKGIGVLETVPTELDPIG